MSDPGRAAPLGTLTIFASTSLGVEDQGRVIRQRRWDLQRTAQKLLPGERVSWCKSRQLKGATHVHGGDGKSYYGGLMSCGNVHTCPICASKVSERRRSELEKAVITWRSKGRAVVLVTYTLQHNRSDKLKTVRVALAGALRRLKSGRWWQDFSKRWGLVHTCKGAESTWGKVNGWHPHAHELVFTELPQEGIDVEAFKAELVDRYTAILAGMGYYASELYGLDVVIGDDQVADYVAKFGRLPKVRPWGMVEEIAKSPVKQGRKGGYSPFQLLELYQSGEKWAGELFKEFAEAMKGVPQLRWSRGARADLGIGPDETDQEIAEQERQELPLLVSLDRPEWFMIVKLEKRGQLLEIARSGDTDLVTGYLQGLWRLWKPPGKTDRGEVSDLPQDTPICPQEAPGRAQRFKHDQDIVQGDWESFVRRHWPNVSPACPPT